jgi:hypothetical protein
MKGLIPMTKAKRVHSTPRKTASKNKAKAATSPEQRDLEASIHQLYCMAEITSDLTTGVHEDQDEMAHFWDRSSLQNDPRLARQIPGGFARRKGGGVMSDVIQFPGISPKRGRASPVSNKPQEDEPEQADWRSRASVKQDIEQHIAAREAFAKAVAWEAVAGSQNLPPAQIEEARGLRRRFRLCNIAGKTC